MATRSIHDDNLVFILAEISDTSLRNLHGICLILVTVKWALDLGSVHLKLGEGTSAECISADDANLPAFLHVVVGEFRASSSLTGALETDKHHYVRFTALILIRFIIRREH